MITTKQIYSCAKEHLWGVANSPHRTKEARNRAVGYIRDIEELEEALEKEGLIQ